MNLLFQYKKLGKLIVITRGEKGASAIKGNEVFERKINNNLNIIDLTGAGDLFAAGFLHGYVNNKSIKEEICEDDCAGGISAYNSPC